MTNAKLKILMPKLFISLMFIRIFKKNQKLAIITAKISGEKLKNISTNVRTRNRMKMQISEFRNIHWGRRYSRGSIHIEHSV